MVCTPPLPVRYAIHVPCVSHREGCCIQAGGRRPWGVYAAGAYAHTHQPVRVTHLQCGGRCACKPTLSCQVCRPYMYTHGGHTRAAHGGAPGRAAIALAHSVSCHTQHRHRVRAAVQMQPGRATVGIHQRDHFRQDHRVVNPLLGHEARRLLPLTQPPPQPGQMLRAYKIRQRRPMRSGPTALATPQTRRHQVLTSSGPGPSMIVAKSRRQIDVRSPDRYPTAARESSRVCWRAWRCGTAPHSAAHRLKTTAQRTRTAPPPPSAAGG